VGLAWGILNYSKDKFERVEPFVILFFLTYLCITLLPIIRTKLNAITNAFKNEAFVSTRPDHTLIVLLPFVVLILELGLTKYVKHGQGIVSLSLGLVYLIYYLCVKKSRLSLDLGYKPKLLLLLGLVFVNLSVPLFITSFSSSAIWALEGGFLIIYAHYFQKDKKGDLFFLGTILEASSWFLYFFGPRVLSLIRGSSEPRSLAKLLDATPKMVVSGYFFTLAAFLGVWVWKEMDRRSDPIPLVNIGSLKLSLGKPIVLGWIFALYGAIWFILSSCALGDLTDTSPFIYLSSGAILGLCFGSLQESNRLASPFIVLTIPALFHAAILGAHSALIRLTNYSLPMGESSSKIFQTPFLSLSLFSIMVGLYGFYLNRRKAYQGFKWLWSLLIFSYAVYLGTLLQNLFHSFNETGPLLFFLPTLAISLTIKKISKLIDSNGFKRWSLISLYGLLIICLPPFFFLGLMREIPEHFGGLLILNALDGYQILYTLAIFMTIRNLDSVKKIGTLYIVPILAFVWLNSLALRVAYKYFHEYVLISTFSHYPHFNASLSIIWATAALLLIFFGKGFKNRSHWFMGAGLLALDIVKLFVVDLKTFPTLLRIFAFLLVGAFLMLIGYLCPLPPSNKNVSKITV
jgi:hypothetical protein